MSFCIAWCQVINFFVDTMIPLCDILLIFHGGFDVLSFEE